MAQSASCLPVVSSGRKISEENTKAIRGSKKAERKDSKRRISCKDLGTGEYEGWLWCKKERPGFTPNSWKKYWFMLKDKSLYCYKDPQDVVAQRLYHLPAFVVSVARESSRKHAFKISHVSFGTVLLAAKDYTDMSKWMTHLSFACERESDACRRKKSDETTGDISESDNDESNIEEEEKKSLQPVAEKEDEGEDIDLTSAASTAVCLSDSSSSAVPFSAAASETESMALSSSDQESTPLRTSGPDSRLLTPCNSKSDLVRGASEPESSSSSSSKLESAHLAASEQEPAQLPCAQPKSTSVHLTPCEPEPTQHTSEALEPAVAAKKSFRPTTLSKPKSSLKSPLSAESPSASPAQDRPSLTRPNFGPATSAKPLRTVPTTGEQSSNKDLSPTGSGPFARARLAFETASSSKPLPSTTRAAPARIKSSEGADCSAKTSSKSPSQSSTNTEQAACTKQSSTNITITAQTEISGTVTVPSLPGKTVTGPAFSGTPSPAVPSAKLSSASEHSMAQLAESTTTYMRNVGPATFTKTSTLPRSLSEASSPSLPMCGNTCSSARDDKAHFRIAKSQSIQREETRMLTLTSQPANEKEELDIPCVRQNSENLCSQSDRNSEVSEDQIADSFQSAEPLPELSATKRAHTRMTHIAQSMKLKTKPSPANRYQELCSRLLVLQRSLKDKMQQLQILEELLTTSALTSDKLKEFCHENKDFVKRLTGNSVALGEGFESDTENHSEDLSDV